MKFFDSSDKLLFVYCFLPHNVLFSEHSVLGEHVKGLVILTCGLLMKKKTKKNKRFNEYLSHCKEKVTNQPSFSSIHLTT